MLAKQFRTPMWRFPMPELWAAAARCFRPVVISGALVSLFAFPLTAQDKLLKEYIYLDGRLLAVERQSPAPVAQMDVQGGESAEGIASFRAKPIQDPSVDSIARGKGFLAPIEMTTRRPNGARPFGCQPPGPECEAFLEIKSLTFKNGGRNRDSELSTSPSPGNGGADDSL
jgi:hypothetical protein